MPEPAVDPQVVQTLASLELPAEHQAAEALFGALCASCHGHRASGSETGPPLVHSVYRPAHHGDAAFDLAVVRGVKAHHWGFGDMAPVPGLAREDVEGLTAYVRWLQRSVGIE